MEEVYAVAELRERLIIYGIEEIETHGLTDFSLRRVASKCGASCAAPYKHFKNKDELILEILRFINRQWGMLEQQLCELFADNPRKLLLELCMANIRFRLGNPHFAAVLTVAAKDMDPRQRETVGETMTKIGELATTYGAAHGDKDGVLLTYKLRSLVYGAALLIGNGELPNTPKTLEMVKSALEKELD